MLASEKTAIADSVNVCEKVNQGILSTGKNQKNTPSSATHFMQNHNSDTESPSFAYSAVKSHSFQSCSARNMITA